MIEAPIIAALKASTALAAIVSVYGGSPAIFSDEAPENAQLPYVTIKLSSYNEDLIIDRFNLYVDYWDHDKSRANSRAAAEAIEFALDNKEFTNDRYSNIRCRKFSADSVEEIDPRDIHYNIQFYIRASRKAFIDQLS